MSSTAPGSRYFALAFRHLCAREWEWTESLKHVHCSACGIKHRDTSPVRTHRAGCEYEALILETRDLFQAACAEERLDLAAEYANALGDCLKRATGGR